MMKYEDARKFSIVNTMTEKVNYVGAKVYSKSNRLLGEVFVQSTDGKTTWLAIDDDYEICEQEIIDFDQTTTPKTITVNFG